jgi:proline iminopeptidase
MRIAVNGTSLWFDVEGPGLVPDGREMRERPTIVLLHGGPGQDHSLFKPTFSQLADVAQLVYVDQRGNGRSQASRPDTWDLDQWGDDVRGLCDALGIERPIVLGWSFGGMVALSYARRHPHHPAKLVLQSTTSRWDTDRIVEGFRQEGGAAAAEAAEAWVAEVNDETSAAFFEHCIPVYSPQPLDMEALTRIVLNGEVAEHFLTGLDVDLRPGLEDLRCPTLILAGARDPITPLSAAVEMAAAFTPGVARLETFEESGHFIPNTEPDRFFSLLRDFITE